MQKSIMKTIVERAIAIFKVLFRVEQFLTLFVTVGRRTQKSLKEEL